MSKHIVFNKLSDSGTLLGLLALSFLGASCGGNPQRDAVIGGDAQPVAVEPVKNEVDPSSSMRIRATGCQDLPEGPTPVLSGSNSDEPEDTELYRVVGDYHLLQLPIDVNALSSTCKGRTPYLVISTDFSGGYVTAVRSQLTRINNSLLSKEAGVPTQKWADWQRTYGRKKKNYFVSLDDAMGLPREYWSNSDVYVLQVQWMDTTGASWKELRIEFRLDVPASDVVKRAVVQSGLSSGLASDNVLFQEERIKNQSRSSSIQVHIPPFEKVQCGEVSSRWIRKEWQGALNQRPGEVIAKSYEANPSVCYRHTEVLRKSGKVEDRQELIQLAPQEEVVLRHYVSVNSGQNNDNSQVREKLFKWRNPNWARGTLKVYCFNGSCGELNEGECGLNSIEGGTRRQLVCGPKNIVAPCEVSLSAVGGWSRCQLEGRPVEEHGISNVQDCSSLPDGMSICVPFLKLSEIPYLVGIDEGQQRVQDLVEEKELRITKPLPQIDLRARMVGAKEWLKLDLQGVSEVTR